MRGQRRGSSSPEAASSHCSSPAPSRMLTNYLAIRFSRAWALFVGFPASRLHSFVGYCRSLHSFVGHCRSYRSEDTYCAMPVPVLKNAEPSSFNSSSAPGVYSISLSHGIAQPLTFGLSRPCILRRFSMCLGSASSSQPDSSILMIPLRNRSSLDSPSFLHALYSFLCTPSS